MDKKLILLLLPLALLLAKCMPYQEEKITEINYSLKDATLQKLLTHQDQQEADSLIAYFRHKDPTYRFAAAQAFGSFKDESAVDSLNALLLREEIEEVKIAVAYALGQIGKESAGPVLLEAFQAQDSLSMNSALSKTILEAIGKCASPDYLTPLSSVSTYLRGDTLLLEGQAWAIYRYALRGEVRKSGTERMVRYLTSLNYPSSVRFVAAHYLSRARGIQLDTFAAELIRIVSEENDPAIKMPLAIALGKTKKEGALTRLLNWYPQEKDYRVKCNIIRALKNFDYVQAKAVPEAALADENLAIASTAANYFLDSGIAREGYTYRQRARDTSLHWQVQTTLLAAANRHTSPTFEATIGSINLDLRRRLLNSENDYEKAAALVAMSEFLWNYRIIHDQAYISEVPVVRTAGVEALANIARNPNFDRFFGLSRNRVKRDLANYFVEAIQNGDAGMIAVAAGALRLDNHDFKTLVDSTTLLVQALNKLQLPKEIETYNELQKTIDHLEGKEEQAPRKPAINHPVDWRMVSTVTDKTTADIITNKGTIRLRLMPDHAPGTVSNFVMLARRGFYESKRIHRVVPNFVIQGGCPRGDGYGSLDYSIRSELSPMNYDREGLVGMASAGNHTECTQWFITHSPTPHLNGNYTIFAEVVEGMDVVHQIEVGDIIKRVAIN